MVDAPRPQNLEGIPLATILFVPARGERALTRPELAVFGITVVMAVTLLATGVVQIG